MDVEWEAPEWALFYRRWAEFCRVIRFDPRGCGSTDPVPLDALPSWESSAAEVLAVMDAVGSERATVLGFLNDGPPAVSGLAVHIAARVLATAGGGEALVSRIVRDLVAGSNIAFEDRASHNQKGVEGEWHLYAVAGA